MRDRAVFEDTETVEAVKSAMRYRDDGAAQRLRAMLLHSARNLGTPAVKDASEFRISRSFGIKALAVGLIVVAGLVNTPLRGVVAEPQSSPLAAHCGSRPYSLPKEYKVLKSPDQYRTPGAQFSDYMLNRAKSELNDTTWFVVPFDGSYEVTWSACARTTNMTIATNLQAGTALYAIGIPKDDSAP